ncbi:hypothetical protein EJ06DRAFT_327658 [Trichodelitschia bisporula]|uniref:Uncharacterized protein n=1 Tax=Trichodelitschia bisporula TaxID=703511 RepID=A0A6G1I2F1_9PEZI|nr:hypothetical protein EJ06DRAFT_327658 [Trichodelitschia bisporula]
MCTMDLVKYANCGHAAEYTFNPCYFKGREDHMTVMYRTITTTPCAACEQSKVRSQRNTAFSETSGPSVPVQPGPNYSTIHFINYGACGHVGKLEVVQTGNGGPDRGYFLATATKDELCPACLPPKLAPQMPAPQMSAPQMPGPQLPTSG